MQTHKASLLSFALTFFVLYAIWGFVFSETVFASNFMVYVCFVAILLFYVILSLNSGFNKGLDLCAVLWIPFILWRVLGYVSTGYLEWMCYWLACLLLICMANLVPIFKKFPVKALYWSGLLILFGILIQLLFPSFYNSHIMTFFSKKLVEKLTFWNESGYGLAGFMSQLDRAAMPMLYTEGLILYFRDRFFSTRRNKRLLMNVLIVLLVVGVFLTGKRMASIMSIGVPLAVAFITSGKTRGKTVWLIFAIVVGAGVAWFFTNYSDRFSDTLGIGRLASTFNNAASGGELDEGRSYLNARAFAYFLSSPVFGIGTNAFLSELDFANHNAYLMVLGEQGGLGLISFIVPMITCLISTIKNIKIARNVDSALSGGLRFSLFCQITYMFCAFSENGLIDLFLYVIYFFSIALMISCKSLLKRQQYGA